MFTLGCCLACLSVRKGIYEFVAKQFVKHNAKVFIFQHITQGKVFHE